MTVGEVVSRCLSLRAVGLAPRTVESYARLARIVHESYLDSSPDGPESAPVAAQLLAQILRAGHGRTAEQLYVFLRMCCPAMMADIQRPRFQRREPVFVAAEEAAQLLQEAEGSPWRLAVWLALCCGLRRGELAGLRWADVDPNGSCLQIRNQRQRIQGRGVIDGPPKSRSGCRTVPVPQDLMAMLQDAYLLACADALLGGSEPVYVLAGDLGGGVDPQQIDKGFQRLCRAAGVKCTVHGLRHTMATLGACAGVPMHVLQRILGHASAGTTATYYTHIYDHALTSAASTIRLTLPLKIPENT